MVLPSPWSPRVQAFGLFVARWLLLRFRFVVLCNHFTLSLCDGIGLLSLQSRDVLGQYYAYCYMRVRVRIYT